MRAEDIPRDEGKVKLVGSRWRMVPRSRFKWDLDLTCDLEWESSRRIESSTMIDGITIDLKAMWRIV
ncbi:hypothetical protein A2U01_0097921, partial [Trifolium medium]|nr:hypothetical protein [Trifolium medium]